MIAISNRDNEKFGCPYCGCDLATLSDCATRGFFSTDRMECTVKCMECNQEYLILGDELEQSTFTIPIKIDGKSKNEYIKVQMHPRRGIPAHEYKERDGRPTYGDYCEPRSDYSPLVCFVKSRLAGERIAEMINSFDGIHCKLNYRPDEPRWIQVSISSDSARESFLREKLRKTGCVITKELVEEVMSMPINFTNTYEYYNDLKCGTWYDYKFVENDLKSIFDGKEVEQGTRFTENHIDFYQNVGIYMLTREKNSKDYNYISNILSSYLGGCYDEYSSSHHGISECNLNYISNMIKLYNEEFGATINAYERESKRYFINKKYDLSDIDSIESFATFMKKLLSSLDYSKLKNAILSRGSDEQTHAKAIKELPEKEIYPLCIILGLLSQLNYEFENIKTHTNGCKPHFIGRIFESLDHVANIEIEDNPYKELFEIIKRKISDYKIVEVKEEKAPQKALNRQKPLNK